MRRARSTTPTNTRGHTRSPTVTASNASILRWASLTATEQEHLASILDNHGIQFRKIMARGGHVHNVAYLRILCDDDRPPTVGRHPSLSRHGGMLRGPQQCDEGGVSSYSSLTISGTISESPEQQQQQLIQQQQSFTSQNDWQETLSLLRQAYPPVFEAFGDTGHDRRHPPAVFNTDLDASGGGKLHRTMEAFYADRGVKDATVQAAKALQSTGQSQTSVASIFVNWLTDRLGLRRLTEQGTLETLLLAHRSREADMMADIFARLLEGSYDATDLLFFLYVRSVVSTTVQVDKSSKSVNHPIIIQLPLSDIESLAKKVFGRDQKTIYDTFLHVLTDEISKASDAEGEQEKPGISRKNDDHTNPHHRQQQQQPLVQVGYFMYIALWVYHHQRPEVLAATRSSQGPLGSPAPAAAVHAGVLPQDPSTSYDVDNGVLNEYMSPSDDGQSIISDYLQSIQQYRKARQELETKAAATAIPGQWGRPFPRGALVSPRAGCMVTRASPSSTVSSSAGYNHGVASTPTDGPHLQSSHTLEGSHKAAELTWVVADMLHACQRSMIDSVKEARQSSRHPLKLPCRDFDAALEPCVHTLLREESTLLVSRIDPAISDIRLPPASGPLVADALNAVASHITTTADELVQIIMDGSVDNWITALSSLLLFQQSPQPIDKDGILNADTPVYQKLVRLRDSILADESGTLRQAAVREFCETLLSSSVLETYCAQLTRRELLEICNNNHAVSPIVS